MAVLRLAGSRTDPGTKSTSVARSSGGARSRTRTWAPRARNAATRWRPIKPLPPVTRSIGTTLLPVAHGAFRRRDPRRSREQLIGKPDRERGGDIKLEVAA